MNHIADANKMVSDTPRTDEAQFGTGRVSVDFARTLERELNAANARIKRLRDGIAKQNQTIEQACGKVLGYPWFKDDQKNFQGSTEKDGVCVGDHVAETIVCEIVGKYTEALDRIKRLEEFARTIENDFDHDEDAHRYGTMCRVCDAAELLMETKTKEDKP